MKFHTLILITFIAVFISTFSLNGEMLPEDPFLAYLELLVEVVDEEGRPVDGSKVVASFRHTDNQERKLGEGVMKFESTYDGQDPVNFTYKSDRNVAVWVEKEGYWTSSLRYKFPEEDRQDKRDGSANGIYKKELKITLLRKVNPRPLYLYKVDWMKVPGFDQPYGFDLERADWVSPYGEGRHADLIFTVRGNRTNKDEFTMGLELSFSNPQDGLIEVPKSDWSKSHLL